MCHVAPLLTPSVSQNRVALQVQRVMSNSFGFGGTNCCLIFDKYEE